MTDAQAIAADIRALIEGLNERLAEAQSAGMDVELQYAFRGDFDCGANVATVRTPYRFRVREISRQELL